MGFLKRFFSLGSRKSKRKHEARINAQADSARRAQEPWQEQEGDSTRLLRSSSTHFAVVNEVDYSTLPPLPHPINSVAHTPVATPTKSTSSMHRRGTYTVKVLERKLESRTEFPQANPRNNSPIAKTGKQYTSDKADEESPLPARLDPRSVPFTPRDQSRLVRLRQDPSVASLLNMYDDKGCISSNAFSNTPNTPAPIHGREAIKRSGSTLRQLLGDPDAAAENGVAEGDISWAERYLGEHASTSQCSLASTIPVETPKDFLFNHNPLQDTKPVMLDTNVTFSSDNSRELSANYPYISSMEVEVSATAADLDFEVDTISFGEGTTPKVVEPKTPMRASEVFGFLTERRKTVLERQKSQRALDATPLATVSLNPSTNTNKNIRTPVANISPDTSDTSIMTSSAQIHTATLTKVTPVANPLSPRSDSVNVLMSSKSSEQPSYVPPPNTRAQHTGGSHTSTSTTSSKIPRGPRPLPATPSASRLTLNNPSKTSLVRDKRHDAHKENNIQDYDHATRRPHTPSTTRIPVPAADPFTPTRPRQQRRITSNTSSVASSDGEGKRRGASKRARKAERTVQQDKENTPPSLPLRTIFDKRYPNTNAKGEPPSPASSSELSPVTRDMMAHLRKQRQRARDGVSSIGRTRSSRRNS